MNWNPFQSSLFTGAGTPWGEGPRDPYQAKYKAFNPDEYTAMDTSKLGQALRQDIGQNAARSRARMSAALQGRGGGGADAIGGMAALEAQQGQDENTLNAKLSQMDLEHRYRQYQDYLENERAKENQDYPRYNRDTNQRNAVQGALAQVGGFLGGSLLGPTFGALGSQIAEKMVPGQKKKPTDF